MRADRLVAILLLMQRRGRVTATEIAGELEVSERTARRDLEALGMAGVPVYAQPGRNGGWFLAGGGKTDLSGLTASEAQALFLVAGPAAGATPEVRAALRKLMRALPTPLQHGAEQASKAVLVDPASWGRPARVRATPVYLEEVQRAVIEGNELTLGYVARDQSPSTRRVGPLGLVAKGPAWYLVAETDAGPRSFRVDRITSVKVTGDRVVKPDGFDLADAWRLITDDFARHSAPLCGHALVAVEAIGPLRWMLGARLSIGPADEDARVRVELRGHSTETLASEIAGFAHYLEVTNPPELRHALAKIGHQLTSTYGPVEAGTTGAS